MYFKTKKLIYAQKEKLVKQTEGVTYFLKCIKRYHLLARKGVVIFKIFRSQIPLK